MRYAAFGITSAAESIFSMKIPYPSVGSATRTWVTAQEYNGAAAHECGQVGTTVFNEKFTVLEMIYI